MLAAEELVEDSAGDNLHFLRLRLRPFAEAGAAVVISDHVTKGTENRGRWARGSGAKLGRYDGVVYEINLVEPYSPDNAGFVRLRVSKDRNGGVGTQGQTVAELHFTPRGDGHTSISFRQPEAQEPFRPKVIMEKIVKHL